jgi:hypothetical protein
MNVNELHGNRPTIRAGMPPQFVGFPLETIADRARARIVGEVLDFPPISEDDQDIVTMSRDCVYQVMNVVLSAAAPAMQHVQHTRALRRAKYPLEGLREQPRRAWRVGGNEFLDEFRVLGIPRNEEPRIRLDQGSFLDVERAISNVRDKRIVEKHIPESGGRELAAEVVFLAIP